MGSPAMPPQELTVPQDKGINATTDIPVIDLASWNEATTEVSSSRKASLAATWHRAFSTHGLVWLVGHGLDPLYEHVAAKWRHFCQQDDAEKRKYSALWYGSSGYNRVGAEAVARSEGGDGEPDPVESLESGYEDQFGGPFPRAATGYPGGDSLMDPCLQLYCQLVLKVLNPCLSIASLALKMKEDELAHFWMEKGNTSGQLRLARYQPDGQPGSQILYAEHTDYNGFTFLWRSRTNGLEAKLNGSWTPIPLLPDNPHALLVNLGDLMEVWTGGVWKSPRHQVLRSSQKQGELFSIVWFTGPNLATPLLPLPSPILPTYSSREDEIIIAGRHVMEKIKKTWS